MPAKTTVTKPRIRLFASTRDAKSNPPKEHHDPDSTR